MITIKKKYKTYGKRMIRVFEDNKLIGEISEHFHWICIDDKSSIIKTIPMHNKLRKVAMENLWWLLHSDIINEDYTEEEAWKEKCDYWNKGWFEDSTINTSLFFPGEYEIALNSINNK